MQPDLTTPQKVKDYLRHDPGEQGERVLQDYIQIASRLVRSATKRRFTSPPEEGVTRTYYTYGQGSVYIDELRSPPDLTGISDDVDMPVYYELTWDWASDEIVGAELNLRPSTFSSESDFGFPPDHADLFITEVRPSVMTRYPVALKVTGTFGYEEGTIPEDVEFATRRAVALWFREEIAHYTDDAFISRGRQFNPEMLPPITMAMLRGSGWVVEEALVI